MKNLKTVFKGENVEVVKLIIPSKNEKQTYVVDTYLDDMYLCIPDDNLMLARVYDAEALRKVIENDSLNEYKFTREAFSRCEGYFSSVTVL